MGIKAGANSKEGEQNKTGGVREVGWFRINCGSVYVVVCMFQCARNWTLEQEDICRNADKTMASIGIGTISLFLQSKAFENCLKKHIFLSSKKIDIMQSFRWLKKNQNTKMGRSVRNYYPRRKGQSCLNQFVYLLSNMTPHQDRYLSLLNMTILSPLQAPIQTTCAS